jgi:release factor glutamine methyltransferase
MTVLELEKTLLSYGAENPREEAYLLLNHLFGASRADTILNRDKDFSSSELDMALEKRKAHVPVQYIIGKWEFMGKEFLVSPDCLIPRPDTEILVEKAIEITKNGEDVADFCTGSGCIGISVALFCKGINLTLVDISEDALNMAKKNAWLHGVTDKCEFVLADVTEDILSGEYGAILSNPPYILKKDMDTLSPEVKNEPYIALCGGEDGLDIIRPIVINSSRHLCDGGILIPALDNDLQGVALLGGQFVDLQDVGADGFLAVAGDGDNAGHCDAGSGDHSGSTGVQTGGRRANILKRLHGSSSS